MEPHQGRFARELGVKRLSLLIEGACSQHKFGNMLIDQFREEVDESEGDCP
jgi:hypothetical protein